MVANYEELPLTIPGQSVQLRRSIRPHGSLVWNTNGQFGKWPTEKKIACNEFLKEKQYLQDTKNVKYSQNMLCLQITIYLILIRMWIRLANMRSAFKLNFKLFDF